MSMQQSLQMKSHIVPVILAGGDGCRLWPLSRPDFPKPFIKIDGHLSQFQKSVQRCQDTELFQAPIIIAGAAHRPIVEMQLSELDVTPAAIIAEPVGRDTAAAIALASIISHNEKDLKKMILVMPSDQKMEPVEDFHKMVRTGLDHAVRTGLFVTFGIKPTRAATEYGYIRRGLTLHRGQAHLVETFVEKPNQALAYEYFESGEFLWNSGMFLFPLVTLRSELQRYCEPLLLACENAIKSGHTDGFVVTPDEEHLTRLPKISVDYALLEKTNFTAVVDCKVDWDDLGSWDAILSTASKDKEGNAIIGHGVMEECSNTLVHSQNKLTAVLGMEDCVIVTTEDCVLVSKADKAGELKTMVKQLTEDDVPQAKRYLGEVRPWGQFAPLHNGDGHQVKIIEVKPQGRLSLQKHSFRAEHWIVVAGMATVTVGNERYDLDAGQHVHIPKGAVHRLENFGDETVKLIEVQTGTYFGEDDIIRLEDVYGRNSPETAIPA